MQNYSHFQHGEREAQGRKSFSKSPQLAGGKATSVVAKSTLAKGLGFN